MGVEYIQKCVSSFSDPCSDHLFISVRRKVSTLLFIIGCGKHILQFFTRTVNNPGLFYGQRGQLKSRYDSATADKYTQ